MAEMLDLIPKSLLTPFFLLDSTASKIWDWISTTQELLSATIKSEQENYSVTVAVSSSFLSLALASCMSTTGAIATRL
jgi:hypothetical protein